MPEKAKREIIENLKKEYPGHDDKWYESKAYAIMTKEGIYHKGRKKRRK